MGDNYTDFKLHGHVSQFGIVVPYFSASEMK